MHAFFADAGNTAAAAFSGFFIIILIAALLYFVLWLYCLINAATRTDFDTSQRIIWVLVLLIIHGIGPILYLLLSRRSV